MERSSTEERALRDLGNRALLGDFRGEDLVEAIRVGRMESDVCTASKMCAGMSIAMETGLYVVSRQELSIQNPSTCMFESRICASECPEPTVI